MSKAKKLNWAVVGRVYGDDEQSCVCTNNATRFQAEREFRAAVKQSYTASDWRRLNKDVGDPVIVLYVLRSDTPIHIEQGPY